MNDYFLLLRQASVERPGLFAPLLSFLALCFLVWIGVAIPLAQFLPGLGRLGKALDVAVGAFLFILALLMLFWWPAVMRGLARQNTPALATLVPGLRARLVRLAIGCWLACALVFSAWIARQLGYFPQVLMLAFAGLSLAMLEARLLRVRVLFLVFLILLFAGDHGRLVGLLDWMAQYSEPPLLLLVASVEVALLAWALRRMLPLQGLAIKEALPRALLSVEDEITPREALRKTGLYEKLVTAIEDMPGMRRHVAKRLPLMLLELVMPDRLDMMSYVARYVVLASVPAVILLSYDKLNNPIGALLWIYSAVLIMVIPAGFAGRIGKNLRATQAEQGLLVLAPGMPAGRQLNRLLARGLLERALGAWLVTVLFSFLLSWAFGGVPPQDWLTHDNGSMIAYCALWLLPVAASLKNYASAEDAGNGYGWTLIIAALTLYVLLEVSDAVFVTLPGYLVAPAVLLTFVLLLLQRWRRMVEGAPVLPIFRKE